MLSHKSLASRDGKRQRCLGRHNVMACSQCISLRWSFADCPPGSKERTAEQYTFNQLHTNSQLRNQRLQHLVFVVGVYSSPKESTQCTSIQTSLKTIPVYWVQMQAVCQSYLMTTGEHHWPNFMYVTQSVRLLHHEGSLGAFV